MTNPKGMFWRHRVEKKIKSLTKRPVPWKYKPVEDDVIDVDCKSKQEI